MNYLYSEHPNSKIDYEMAKFICENYGKMSSGELSKKLGVTSTTILNCLKLNKIPVVKAGHFLLIILTHQENFRI